MATYGPLIGLAAAAREEAARCRDGGKRGALYHSISELYNGHGSR